MIKHTLITTRPNLEVSWYPISEEFNLFREENFILTGKIISREDVLSDDQLIRTITTNFRDLESYTEFINDIRAINMQQDRNAYNKENGMVGRGNMQII